METAKTPLHSKIYIQELKITKLDRIRTIRILLPEAYFKNDEKRFPVMYLFDGQNLFDNNAAYFKPWDLQTQMDKLPLKDQIILVGIDNGGHHRNSEYLPKHYNRQKGEGEILADFIIHELKPKVDHHLRTLGDKENTMICGSSMGGLLAFYIFTNYNNVFGKAGILSPSFWAYPMIYSFKPTHYGKIYVSGSQTESRSMSKTLENTYHALKKAGYADAQIRIVVKSRGKHSELLWRSQFNTMLKWLLNN